MSKSAVQSQPEVILNLNQELILIRVLHVDDEAESLKLTKELLEIEGKFQVDTALSVQEAFEKLKEKEFDAVVSDYMMPETDGISFLKELRERGNNIPFIVFTGKGTEEVAKAALNLGADHYISKAGDPEQVYSELAQSIAEAVKIRKSEQELRESLRRFRAISDFAAEALVSIDAQGKIIFWNKMAEKIFGYSADEISGKSAFGFIAPKDSLKAKELLKAIFDQAKTKNGELTVVTKDGREFLAELSASPILDPSGRPTSIVVVAKDIGKRKKAEQALLESHQKFERVFRGNPEAAVYLSPDFQILDINPRFAELFAYSLNEIKGKDINEVIVPREKLKEGKMLDRKAEKGYVYYDTVRKKKDGSLVAVSVSAAPIIIERKLLGHVALYKDISELKSTETALKQTMEKLATMNEKLQVVGRLTRHDVRNKLSAVTGNVFLLRKKLADHTELSENLKDIDEACRQIVRIFEFARNYEALGDEELKYVNVAETFEKAVSQFSELKDTEILNECKGLKVLADSLLTRLFYNLIDNSLKYGEKTSQIKVHYEKTRQGQLKLTYQDNGVGIPLAEKSSLFREGYGKGTGHGLYLVRRMMEVYGWTIRETGEPGKGAQFTITIPRTNRDGKETYHI